MNDVCITFRARVEAGDSGFVVPIQRKFASEPNRRYGFESITVMPEYQNTQAFAYDLDSKQELEMPIVNPFELEVLYGPNYFSKDIPGKVWSYLQSQKKLDAVLVSMNQHFESKKPPGSYYPAVFFDWVHLLGMEANTTMETFVTQNAMAAYGEEYAAEKHRRWMPASLVNLKNMTPCNFPSVNTADFLADVRVRMWIAPNTTIAFSNVHLLQVLGFTPSQIPTKTGRGQFMFANASTERFTKYMCYVAPTFNMPVEDLKGTKINCYVTNKVIRSALGQLSTVKKRERNPAQLAEDYSSTLTAIAKRINVYMNLSYDPAEKVFKIAYPNNPNISIRIHVPTHVKRQLGYNPFEGNSEIIEQREVPSPVKGELDISDLEKKAHALVYDTGMLVVDLDEQSSHLSSHSGNFLMTTLHPRSDGTLRNRVYLWDVPRVSVSSTHPNLSFVLYRFDDENKKQPLGWPVGAYVFGTLNGRV